MPEILLFVESQANTKKESVIGASPKGRFSNMWYISKEVCRILLLWTQMQCLSGKLTSHR